MKRLLFVVLLLGCSTEIYELPGGWCKKDTLSLWREPRLQLEVFKEGSQDCMTRYNFATKEECLKAMDYYKAPCKP